MNTDELISHSRARFDHHQARIVLKEKYQAKMTFAYGGGMWRAGPELQSTIFTCGKIGEAILLDLYETPVKIDTTELMALSQQRWQEQMNAWLVEYEELNKNR
jgi:hypothetical protein